MQSETQEKLANWGAWTRSGGVSLGCASSGLALMRARSGGGLPMPVMSDEEALRVDRAVAQLRRYSVQEYDCIWLAYVRQFGARAIRRETGLAVNTVTARLASAERWIEDFLKIC